MDTPVHVPLTPEQLAAVQAGGGFACVEDPTTHRVFFLIEKSVPATIDDDYVRQKIDEAYADGEEGPLDMAALKAEFFRRQAEQNQSQ